MCPAQYLDIQGDHGECGPTPEAQPPAVGTCRHRRRLMMVFMQRVVVVLLVVGACSDEPSNPMTNPDDGPPAGNPDGACAVPAEAQPEDIATPTTVVGDGSPAKCTSKEVV